MGCACGKGRTARKAVPADIQFVYDYTAPGAEEPVTYGTPLEAKRAVRRAGGGTVKRRQVAPVPAA